KHARLFAADTFLGSTSDLAAAGFNLDKHELVAIHHHQIQFAVVVSPVALAMNVTLALQISADRAFCGRANLLAIIVHGRAPVLLPSPARSSSDEWGKGPSVQSPRGGLWI